MADDNSTQKKLSRDFNSSFESEPEDEIFDSSTKENGGQPFDEISDEEIAKKGLVAGLDCRQKERQEERFPLCKYCSFHTIFKHDGEDPIFKKGIWVKTGKGICTRHHSLDMQNNRGIWYICDTETAQKCHLYEAR